jgi:hypothetical protein
MKKKAKPKKKKSERLKRLSFYPLKAEEAIKLVMQIKPEKIGINIRRKK